MVSKTVLVAAVIVIVLAVGGVYILRGPTQPVLTPTPTTTQTPPTTTPTITETPTPTLTPTPTTSPTPATAEENSVKAMVMAYYDAFNRHSVDDEIAFFTEGAEKIVRAGDQVSTFVGHRDIMRHLLSNFKKNPDSVLSGITITQLSVTGNKAQVQAEFMYKASDTDLPQKMTEIMELAKIDYSWKITKTELTAGR